MDKSYIGAMSSNLIKSTYIVIIAIYYNYSIMIQNLCNKLNLQLSLAYLIH